MDLHADIAVEVARLDALEAKHADPRFARAAEALYAPAPTTRTADRKSRRQAIRAMAATFFPKDKPKPQAVAIDRAMRRYHYRGGWKGRHRSGFVRRRNRILIWP